MKELLAKSRGKNTENFPFPHREKHGHFPENFPKSAQREKHGKIPRISLGEKILPPKGGNGVTFPDGQWVSSCAIARAQHQLLPLH